MTCAPPACGGSRTGLLQQLRSMSDGRLRVRSLPVERMNRVFSRESESPAHSPRQNGGHLAKQNGEQRGAVHIA
jgi:hypothetical protein